MVEELRSIVGPGELDLFSELAGQFVQQMPSWLEEIKSQPSGPSVARTMPPDRSGTHGADLR
jgi:hypothetical protein